MQQQVGCSTFGNVHFCDLGQTGPDQGKGAKYLILGPGHPAMNPKGYIVVRSPHWHVFPRSSRSRSGASSCEAADQRHTNFIPTPNATKVQRLDTSLPRGHRGTRISPEGVTYFERLANILKVEPVEKRDLMMMAMLRPLGMMPNTEFKPSDRQKKLFEQASLVGEAIARANSYQKRFDGARLWPGKRWELSLFLTDTDQDPRNAYAT